MSLLTIEGIDGAGGTTLVEELSDYYNNVVTTAEPSGREYGKLVRRNLSQNTDPLVDFFLFMADRRDHIEEEVKRYDNGGQIVISDRYADSTRAYQPVAMAGESDDKPFDSVWEAKHFIEQSMASWNYEPDLTIYIDISVDTAIERSAGDEKYEKREFLENVKDNYDALAETRDHIVTIDGEQSVEGMVDDAIEVIEENL